MIDVKYLIALLALSATPAFGQQVIQSPDGIFLCHGDHPRCSWTDQETYPYYQFGMQHVGQFAGVSDQLENGPPLIQYQSFLSELITKRPDTNAVSLWADAASVVNGGRVWGGFLSARSGLPAGADSQLIGLEIDVLNGGLPGVAPNASKVGLQIVGFGNANTNAIEVLTDTPNAAFQNALNIAAHSVAANGTVIGVGPQNAALGINLQYSHFSDAAMLMSENQKIVFRTPGTGDAAIWRDDINNGHLVLQAGPAGLRIVNSENNANLLIVTPQGDLVTAQGSLSGTLSRLSTLEQTAPTSSFSVSANNASARAAPSASGADSLAVGSGAVATGNAASAIGNSAAATGSNSVALGAGSTDAGHANVVSVGSASLTRRITNVSTAMSATDAINLSQLNNAVSSTRDYVDSRVTLVTNQVSQLRRESHASAASAMAVAAIPQTFERGKGMIGFGVGTWQGERAMAIGVSKATYDGRIAFKAGATYNSQGSGGANAGVGFAF